MEVYRSDDPGTSTKADDTPVTRADLAADAVIRRSLEGGWDWPLLSEEREVPWEVRRHWTTFWLVDPLDGTRGFIKRNAAFTVNIALVHDGRPVAGVVLDPQQEVSWAASLDGGLTRNGVPFVPPGAGALRRAAASHAHRSSKTRDFLHRLGIDDVVSAGSSIKFALVAEGRVEIYPRLGPTSEWDTAAGQVLVEAAGGRVVELSSGKPLTYGKQDVRNPHFIALRGGVECPLPSSFDDSTPAT